MNDLKELCYYLGIEFVRHYTEKTITMSQNKYIKEILKQFNIDKYKLIITSLEPI